MSDRDIVELVMLPPGTKKTAANTHDSEWMPVKPITIQNEAAKSQAASFSQDENYRAYKFFSIVDFDNAGSINPRKLFKLLFGDYINTFTAVFTHQDTGVVWGLDEEDQVCIAHLEEGSPASQLPTLVDKLRLLRINNLKVPPLGGSVSAIRAVRAAIKQIRRGKVIFEFLEPSLTISPFSRYIDIEVEGLDEMQTVDLPVGATPPPSLSLNTYLHTLLSLLFSFDHVTSRSTAQPFLTNTHSFVLFTIATGAVYDLDRFAADVRQLFLDHPEPALHNIGMVIATSPPPLPSPHYPLDPFQPPYPFTLTYNDNPLTHHITSSRAFNRPLM